MGIEAKFKQVSPYLLEKLKKYPDFAQLFFDAKYLPDSPLWQKFTINSDDPDDVELFDEYSNFAAKTLQKLAVETLQKLKEEKPEEFEKLKADIPVIIEEGKAEYFDADKTWREIHFLLTGYDYSVRLNFLVGENEEDGLPSINAVLSGNEIEHEATYGLVRYLTADEVKQVAEALSKYSHAMIKERLKFRGWQEDYFDHLFDYKYYPLVRYYQDAAEKGNAMFLYLS
ncbi:DUF1877 family protein [Coleofasciculus sp. FACHB-1120]|uniref:DUF1877 family protein n=1 Tax=Coleofasciculus sp. FACHB-1120 TaxID=2692783 RepID=UPI001688EBF7|nr:DUF1877 family protein [Coleofasciculus sp. FACHB-1120]MBD2741778.1 DUF1877 family protein [Coleofasciculus sp. FACHB-1120]